MTFVNIIIGLIGLGLGGAVSYSMIREKMEETPADEAILQKAKEQAGEIKHKSKEQIARAQKILQDEEKYFAEHEKNLESTLKQKEELLERKEHRNKSYEGSLKQVEKQVEDLQKSTEQISDKMIAALAQTAGATAEKAKAHIEKQLNEVITENREARTKGYIEEYTEEAQIQAKAVLRPVIQRLQTQSSVDKNSTTVNLKSDKFKGILIGKGGQNIQYLESLLPVSIIFNLDPMEIHVGGVNLLRRHIAKGAINRLQKRSAKSGKIDPPMVKECVEESEKEIMGICDNKGKEAMQMMDIDFKTLDPELVNLVGRMYFRTSFGQNVLQHSIEMAHIARLLAEQIGSDSQTAMLAAFYHDIGKAVDHDLGGSHDDLSKEILEKYNFPEEIVYAAFAHHDKVPCVSPADFIVKAADAISSVRPGARQESVTNYFERIKQLEETAKSYGGIKKVYTMSAGREVRVIVDEKQIKDNQMQPAADSIAEKISEELSFPGIIKVNLIREIHAVDYAKEKK
ncbi:DUF3552 domain-containing protein [Patescibacteria group bacterium]|nr:DUF3552 domain-containing protein [Patescibacteria group bacterium]